MSRSIYNYICITEDGNVKKYAAKGIDQILEETNEEYQSIIRQDVNWGSYSEYELLPNTDSYY